ncbi:hypothetical protein GOM49_15985 [Clostridium bovifaecis]|uniref:Uncharacterized protein n=1 Tax=Clostridium bovifaecis TaxID=2184719 RepID=A0A6I6F1I8_9CLOT|nr:hypothetical protein GOM49_15985 [Clostridium bovifaecis]
MIGSKVKIVEQQFIPDFPSGKNFNKYYQMVMEDFQIVKSYFPLLQIICLPTMQPKEIFITGNLIPVEILRECVTPKDIERNSLYILGIYPNDYPDDNIYVEDFYEKINWDKIPYEHRHQNLHPKTYRKVLCTHHPDGEVNALIQGDRTVAILSSAWKLYKQYKEYLKTKEWTLKDLRHGHEGTLQLKRAGRYYGR